MTQDYSPLRASPVRKDTLPEAVSVWRPIADAPRDGTAIWAFLYDSGIRLVRWMGPEECAAYDGSVSIDDYDGVWCEVLDEDEDWRPTLWAALADIPIPAEWAKAVDRITGQDVAREGAEGVRANQENGADQ